MKKHIPNTVTCLNLLAGCIGIVMAFNGKLNWASYLIIIAAFFDFLDGMIARLLKAYSEIGKQLDSLADMISFGFLPAAIVYQLFLVAPQVGEISPYLNYSAFLIAIFSALRLAKFNIDERQTENFIGLPTPANALLIASLPLIIQTGSSFFSAYILNAFFLFIFSLGMSLLLVMEIPLFSLKFKSLGFRENLFRYILLIAGLFLILILNFAAIPLIIFLYIILSVIQFRLIR
ncbi:CDP-diacylglycerol--serine O-phosphatidyltransferase [Pedobacter sp. HMF7647]|uniref:CDP-diacylglycerol--serine O-phosphatidyltransferase n=1 Tax=Hufsiella arboris TaxID=2695275 RepID=A0A7K1YES8_9SPHI|nr:CDP-diacylglycerol--serine O-phosphatidyltransferase [Hufsiella arboris]